MAKSTQKADKTKVVKSAKKESTQKAEEPKAVLYSKIKSDSFIKLENPLSLEQLKQRENIPAESDQFVFEDGTVYSLSSGGFTNKNGKQILNNYL